jgi:hypothetical protein
VLNSLSTGFDKLQYGTMLVSTPRLTLEQPIRWLRDEQHPKLTGALSLDAGKPPSAAAANCRRQRCSRSTAGIRPGSSSPAPCTPINWPGAGDRALGWRTSARPGVVAKTVADRVPAAGAAGLEDEPARRQLYAQVAFSAAAGQGFEAGGHGVLKGGSAWMPDNQINGVDFVLPFRFSDGTWQLGTRRPVSLRIGEVVNQVTARNLTADLQGTWPWSEATAAVEQRQRRYSRRQADHAAAADAAARPGAAASAKYLQQRTDQRDQSEAVRHVRPV